jgi:hypothetical protein
MRKIVTFFAVAALFTLVLTSCGATKHKSKCDAYGSVVKTTGDLAKK